MTEVQNSSQNTIPDLIPLSKFNEYFKYPSVGALRQYNFNAHRNGFDKVIRRIGCRLYIFMPAFKEWVDNGTRQKACKSK